MGREARILLAMLGLLVGVFVGVLSMKLLVPRPPAGAGADIRDEIAAVTPADIVEPPALSPSDEPPAALPEATSRSAGPSRFTAVAAGTDADVAAADESAPPPNPFGARTTFDEPPPLAEEAAREARPIAVAETPAANPRDGVAEGGVTSPVVPTGFAPAPVAGPTARGSYVSAAGDSWWSLAERTYGDGRLYRALFAWNRAINPRVSLVPGTALELPSRSRLAAAWPALVPGE
jgi:nucleoid-associated protein YgaU